MLLEGSELLSVLANRVCDNQLAEIKRLRVENRFLRDTGRVSVVIEGPDVYGEVKVLATATLSQRECLEQRSLGKDVVRVRLSPTVRVWRLGSLPRLPVGAEEEGHGGCNERSGRTRPERTHESAP